MNKQFFDKDDLIKLKIKHGKNCLIHRSVNISNPRNLTLGSNVRIDAFTNIVTKNKVKIKSFVHIASHNLISANCADVVFENYSGTSSGVKIYTHSDDFTGTFFFGPFNKKEKPKGNKIIFGKFVVVGTNSVILPGAGSIPEGVSIGALSLVNSKLKKWSIYTGNPAKFILPRKKLIKRKV